MFLILKDKVYCRAVITYLRLQIFTFQASNVQLREENPTPSDCGSNRQVEAQGSATASSPYFTFTCYSNYSLKNTELLQLAMNTSLSRCRNELFSNTKQSPSQLNAESKTWERYNHFVSVQTLPKGNLSSSNGERDKQA